MNVEVDLNKLNLDKLNPDKSNPGKLNSDKLKGVYAITDEELISEQTFNLKVEHALQGGAKIIQYRDKSKNTKKRLQQAQSLRQLCEKYQALCIINDDIMLAKTSNAHGVHLGKNDASLFSAREILGKDAIIGVSCYNDLSLAIAAEKNGASYVAFGAIFPSPTKPDAPVAGLELITQAKQQLTLPVCTIGGITQDNIQQVIYHGADMAAVISEIFSTDNKQGSDVKTATQNLHRYFN